MAAASHLKIFAAASAPKHEKLRRFGVHEVVDYHDSQAMQKLRTLNADRPLDAIIDLVSQSHARQSVCHVSYGGHLVSVLGRINDNPIDSFTMCPSLHEVALSAAHQYGNDGDWFRLRESGERGLEALLDGTLEPPPIVVGDFDDLPSHLADYRSCGGGRKYVVRVSAK